jgi:hypothetical protein
MVGPRLHFFHQLCCHSAVHSRGWVLGSGLFWLGHEIHLHLLKIPHFSRVLCRLCVGFIWGSLGKSGAFGAFGHVSSPSDRLHS